MSEIKVDTLTGKTSAGDITVTSEGGAATQSLQQGLAKVWINHNQVTSHSIRDSLNISSITDAGTGKTYPISFSNNMSSSSYSGVMYSSANTSTNYDNFANAYTGGLGSKTTSSFGHASFGTAFVDATRNDDVFYGGLA